MKRYELVLEMIKKLQAEEARLENPIEYAYNDMMKNWDSMSNRNRCKEYWEKLNEQNREINLQIKAHKRNLAFFDSNNEIVAMIDKDDLYIPNTKFIPNKELPRFTLWLMMLNEEVKS